MTVKVSWGTMLENHEIARERAAWEQAAAAILDQLHDALAGTRLEIVQSSSEPYICVDCPERAHECSLCHIDATCTAMLRQQVVHLSVIIAEDADDPGEHFMDDDGRVSAYVQAGLESTAEYLRQLPEGARAAWVIYLLEILEDARWAERTFEDMLIDIQDDLTTRLDAHHW